MRYHIDTIPLWDAMKLGGECFLCALHRKIELGEAERYLGASVMEPDVRIKVNKLGFCNHHTAMLYGMNNRLGHALMLHTHLMETEKEAAGAFNALEKAAAGLRATASLGDKLNGKAAAARKQTQEAAERLSAMSGTCIICDSIKENIDRYLHTFFHLYKNDGDFRRAYEASKGLCLPDAAALGKLAADELPARDAADFVELTVELMRKNLKRTEDDIAWFIKKFDYRFEAEPWRDSKDAVERTANKLRGWSCGAEPWPEK